MMMGSTVAMPHIKAGTLRPLGLVAAQRLPSLPDVPTMNESGFPGVDGATPYASNSPAEFEKLIRAELQKWPAVLTRAGIDKT